jgi:hypothetical protein
VRGRKAPTARIQRAEFVERKHELAERQHERRCVALLDLLDRRREQESEGKCKGCGRSLGCNCYPDAGMVSHLEFVKCMEPLFTLVSSMDEADAQFVEATKRLLAAGIDEDDVENVLDAYAFCSEITQRGQFMAAVAELRRSGY